MRSLYTFFIHSFHLLIQLSSVLGNNKAKDWVKGRKDLFGFLERNIDTSKEVVWFHCASVGEFEQARPLLEKVKKENKYFILLSFYSPSGYNSKKNYEQADLICYLPLDTSKNAKRFLEIVQPKLSFFAKYEFWFNFLNELQKGGYAHYLISGIFREKQQFFRYYGAWFRKHLKNFTHLYLQDENSKRILNSFQIQNCSVSGDGRFDRVKEIAEDPREVEGIENFIDGKTCVVFGSSWQKENNLAYQMAKNSKDTKIIIAPHEYQEEEIKNLSRKHELEVQLYSNLGNQQTESNILIIDKMGLLSRIYRYGDIAVIGGGFKSGIHNILEAAVYGMPIFFGPKYDFFKEAVDLSQKGGAKVFKNDQEFHSLLLEVLTDHSLQEQMGQICTDYFKANIGATNLIYRDLKSSESL